MKCPKCKTELLKGKKNTERDGTEYFELSCPGCGKKFLDIKIPKSSLSQKVKTKSF